MTIVIFPISNVVIFVTLLFFSGLSLSVMDVVVDGLMVVQSRIDPNYGSEDL